MDTTNKNTTLTSDLTPEPVSFAQAFIYWLKLGFISFGGPAGQMGSRSLIAYPRLYRKLREWGFECGDGWFDLVWQLSGDIESAARLEGIPENSDSWPSVGVLKYKFGDLRVQFTAPVNDNVRGLVEKARDKSVDICEICAAPCESGPRSVQMKWIEPLCESCRKANRSPDTAR